MTAARWCIVGTTLGGVYRMLKEWWNSLVGHQFCDCLVLDEASQMNLPEAVMAALPLHDDAQLIVVGDQRQMPPSVKHDWAGELRRTFQEFQVDESLFRTLLPLKLLMLPLIPMLYHSRALLFGIECRGQLGPPRRLRRADSRLTCNSASPLERHSSQ